MFVSHAGGGGGAEQGDHFAGGVACFFEEFAAGAVWEGFVGEVFFIANEAGADFEDAGLDGAAVLLDEDDVVVLSGGEDADDGGGIRPDGEFPVVDLAEGEEASFVKGGNFCHFVSLVW